MSRRVALLIATYEYQDPGLSRLLAPAHDAEALAAVLADPRIAGFDVTTLVNEPHHRVGEAIGDLYQGLRRDDLALLYFTGHGLKDDRGQLYLATVNTRSDNLLFTSLPAAHIDSAMAGSMSRRKVLILDCCYSGAFPAGPAVKSGPQAHALDSFRGRGRTVLTASDATQYAFEGARFVGETDGEVPQSVFTRHLVAGLRDGAADLDNDGDITLDELYTYVYDRVVAENPKQHPKRQDDVEGRIVLARNVNWTLPGHLTHALGNPLPEVRLGALTGLAALHLGGNAHVRERVAAEFRRLTDDDSRSVSAAATAWVGEHGAANEAPGGVGSADGTAESAFGGVGPALAEAPRPGAPAEPPPVGPVPPRPRQPPLAQPEFAPAQQIRQIRVAEPVTVIRTDRVPLCVALSPDGTLLAAAGASDTVTLWNAATRALLGEVSVGEGVTRLSFSRDSSRLVAAGDGYGYEPRIYLVAMNGIRVIDSFAPAVREGRTRMTAVRFRLTPARDKRRSPAVAVFSPVHPFELASGGGGGSAVLTDANESGAYTVLHRARDVTALAYSPDGALLATGGADGDVRVWDVRRSRSPLVSFPGQPLAVRALAFSPDGTVLVAVCGDGSLSVWQGGPKSLVPRFTRDLGFIPTSVAFAPDGSCFISGDNAGVRSFDVERGEPGRVQLGGGDFARTTVHDLALSKNGTLLATADDLRSVRLWDVTALRRPPTGSGPP